MVENKHIMSGMTNINDWTQKANAFDEESGTQESARSTNADPEKEKDLWKQPRPSRDNWAEETKKARDFQVKLLENMASRKEALKAGM